jgi:hypothetical protein
MPFINYPCHHQLKPLVCNNCGDKFYSCIIYKPKQFVCSRCDRLNIVASYQVEAFYKWGNTLAKRRKTQLASLEKEKKKIRDYHNFHITPDGHRYSEQAWEKKKQYAREYWEAHRDQRVAQKRARYQANIEIMREKGRQNYQLSVMRRGLDTIDAYNKHQYQLHRDEILERRRLKHRENAKKINAKRREYYATHRVEINQKAKLRRLKKSRSWKSAGTPAGTNGTVAASGSAAVKVGTNSSNAAASGHTQSGQTFTGSPMATHQHDVITAGTPSGTNTPGAATSFIQPYLVVYMWKRTA